MKQFMVIVDVRTDKQYIDKAGSIIRNFEKIVDEFDSITEAKENYPDAMIIETAKGSNVIDVDFGGK